MLDLSAPEAKEAFADVQPGDEIECVVRGVVKEVEGKLVMDPITSYEYEGYEYDLAGQDVPGDREEMEPQEEEMGKKGGGLVLVIGAGKREGK